MAAMRRRIWKHDEVFNLFGECLCFVCTLMRLVKYVIEQDFPTHIDAFVENVCEYIFLNDEREPSARRQTVSHIRHFARWCKAHDITDIREVRREHVESFVCSATVVGGKPRRPGLSTERNRLAGLRSGMRASRAIGYELPDPTIDIKILIDRTVDACICSDADIEKMRAATPEELFDSSYGALLALAEAGASNGEIREVKVSDVNLEEGLVRLPGNARVDERINPMTDWGIEVLRARLARLAPDDFVVWNFYGSRPSEATISQMFRQIAAYGAVGRRGYSINSVRGWRAHVIYTETGRIQDAAVFLGSRSLDSTVAMIGLEWRHTA
jgi:site-specific recombinase XerD